MSSKRTDSALKERMNQWHAYVLGSSSDGAPEAHPAVAAPAPLPPARMDEAPAPLPFVSPAEPLQAESPVTPAQTSLPPLPELPAPPAPDPLPAPAVAAPPSVTAEAPAARPPKPKPEQPPAKRREKSAPPPPARPHQPSAARTPLPEPRVNLPALLPEPAATPALGQAVVQAREDAGRAQDDRLALLEAAIAQTLERSRLYAQTQGPERARPSRVPTPDGKGARILPALYPPSEPLPTREPWYRHAIVRALACVLVLAAFAAFTAYVFLHRS